MIALYLRPDKTQLVKARLKKDQTLSVSCATEIQSYWAALTDEQNSSEENSFVEYPELADLFKEIKTVVPTLYEEVHVVLPDTLFCSINCGEGLTDEDYMEFVREKTEKPDEEVYYSFPITTAPGGQSKKTFFAIDRTIINRLIVAAQKENISLISVEPASYSFIRCCNRWKEEHFLIEIFEKQAMMVSYSPVSGMFGMSTPSLAGELLATDLSRANQEFKSNIALHDFTAAQFFSSMNVNVPFKVLTDQKDLLSLEAFNNRLAEPERLPECVDVDIPAEYQQDWLIPIGTLLQSMDKDLDDLPAFLQLSSANILPSQIQMTAKFNQWKNLVKKYSRIMIICFIAITCIESMGILYYNSITIDPKLQADFDAAQKNIKDIDAEIKVLAAAKKEHEYPMEAFSQIMKDRPDNCGFSSVSIGVNGNSAQNANEKWVHLNVVSSDPLVLQNFASTLSEDEMFTHVALNKMDTDASGFKMADLTLGKGKVQ